MAKLCDNWPLLMLFSVPPPKGTKAHAPRKAKAPSSSLSSGAADDDADDEAHLNLYFECASLLIEKLGAEVIVGCWSVSKKTIFHVIAAAWPATHSVFNAS